MVRRLRGGGGPDPRAQQESNPQKKAKKEHANLEMGLAAGGLIRQGIETDRYQADTWDLPRAILFNVQILNSIGFEAATGFKPPPSPLTASAYAMLGYPYFKIWDEVPSGIKGSFKEVRSVNALDKTGLTTVDKTKAIDEVDKPHRNPIVLLDSTGQRTQFRPLSELKAAVQAASLKTKINVDKKMDD